MNKHIANTEFVPSRRGVLLGGGALVVSFSLADLQDFAFADSAPATKTVAKDEVDAYLAIDGKSRVIVYSGKVDLGTGVPTALAQIVADELDVPLTSIDMITGDTALTPDQGTTSGSFSIQNGGMQIRQAAATARNALLDEAAKRLGAGKDDLTVADGTISTKSGKSVKYAELVGGKRFTLKLDPKAPTKNPAHFTNVGKSIARPDIPQKVTGRFTYMQDFRVPGMLHGRVVHPTAIGATLESVDQDSVKNIPGVVQVVHQGNFLAVVAQNEWAAIKGAQQIKATWSKSETLPEQAKLWDHVRAAKVAKEEVTSNVGDTGQGMAGAGKKISATYDFPIHTHGSIGPSCAIADFRDGKLTSWSASQATHALRRQLAEMFAMPAEDIRCIYVEGSGCYGRNGHEDAAAEAALLAKAVGKPVRVQWMRADEHGWDPKGPPTLIDLRAGMDASGNVTAWESEFFMPQGAAAGSTVGLLPAELAGMPTAQQMAPGGITGNSAIPYKFANVKTVCHRIESTPFRPSWIRAPGRLQNCFANESFMDELAAAAGADPLEFRVKHLDPAEKRGLEILDRLAALAKWGKRPSPQTNNAGNIVKGRGLTYVKYELVRTYIGAVAEVEVDRSSGNIHVTRFYVVHDCGQIINPDGVKAQIEGNVIQTVSRTLVEELTFDRSMVTSLDWASYPILTFPQVPEIVIDLIDRPTEKPWGAGEPTASVVPSAISNAVFDATGVRLRSAPFTPAKMKAALHGA